MTPTAAAPLRTQRDHGRYAHRVRINAAHGSAWNGKHGTVARIVDGVPFVRFGNGQVVPFGLADLEVIS